MCQKCVSSFQKRPWRIRRLVQHCMGVRGKLNRSCPCPTLHTVHFCNIVWGRGERKKILIIFFEKKFFFKKLHFHFFSAHFPGNSSKQIRCSGCRKFRRVATAVGNFRRLATAAGNFAMLLRLSGIYKSFAENADLKLYPVDFPDFSGNLPMGSLRKSPKIGKSSGSNLHSSISWIFAQNAEWSLDPADFSIFPEICRWGAHENQKNTENRPGPTSTVGSRGAPRYDPKGP